MCDSVLIDGNYCANCSCSLRHIKSCYKIYKIDILVHVPAKQNGDYDGIVTCEQVSVMTALRDLFNFELYESCYDVPTKSKTSTGNCKNNDLPVCLTCSLILQDLYKSYTLFKSVRKESSYVSLVTEKIQQIFKPEDKDKCQNQRDPLGDAESSQESCSNSGTEMVENINSDLILENSTNPSLTVFKTEETTNNVSGEVGMIDNETDCVDVNMSLDEDQVFTNLSSKPVNSARSGTKKPAAKKTTDTAPLAVTGASPSNSKIGLNQDNDSVVSLDAKTKKKSKTSKKGKICWVVKETFTDEETARNFMLPDWKVNHTFIKSDRHKQISYYCAKHKIFRCNAKAKLFYETTGDRVEIKYCEAIGFNHTVRMEGPPLRHTEAGLIKEQKDVIRELIQKGYTDTTEIITIVQNTVECPEPQPKRSTLQTFVRRQKLRMSNLLSQAPHSLNNSKLGVNYFKKVVADSVPYKSPPQSLDPHSLSELLETGPNTETSSASETIIP